MVATRLDAIANNMFGQKEKTAVSLEEDEDSGKFKSRMSRMIKKQKEVISRARVPST
jgi:hypothetical protein